jgi:hypothetical protein
MSSAKTDPSKRMVAVMKKAKASLLAGMEKLSLTGWRAWSSIQESCMHNHLVA